MNAPATITSEQLRAAGYTCMDGLLDATAFRLLCAWNGVDPEKGPPAWWAAPNNASREAWGRVAAEARNIFVESHP